MYFYDINNNYLLKAISLTFLKQLATVLDSISNTATAGLAACDRETLPMIHSYTDNTGVHVCQHC